MKIFTALLSLLLIAATAEAQRGGGMHRGGGGFHGGGSFHGGGLRGGSFHGGGFNSGHFRGGGVVLAPRGGWGGWG